jgi:hypothetical protein
MMQHRFGLSVGHGSYARIKVGTAKMLTVQWPAQVRLAPHFSWPKSWAHGYGMAFTALSCMCDCLPAAFSP